MTRTKREIAYRSAGALVLAAAVVPWAVPGTAVATGGGNDKVTICHATSSKTNPYNKIEVAKSAVDGRGSGDHYKEHTGPVFTEGMKSGWGDIIPPVSPYHNGRNWDSAGKAIYNTPDCSIPKACPTVTVTATATKTVPGPTKTVTATSTAWKTKTATATTTAWKTKTATATSYVTEKVTETYTYTPDPVTTTATVVQTVPGPETTTTVTEKVTITVTPDPVTTTATTTQTVPGPESTVTETETVTQTVTATEAGPETTVTETVTEPAEDATVTETATESSTATQTVLVSQTDSAQVGDPSSDPEVSVLGTKAAGPAEGAGGSGGGGDVLADTGADSLGLKLGVSATLLLLGFALFAAPELFGQARTAIARRH